MIRLKSTLLLFLSFLIIAQAARAQNSSITGSVTDQSGGVLPGVTVTAVNQLTNVKTVVDTNELGYYTISNLNPALYQLTAELPGFKKYFQSDIELDVEEIARIDIRMQVGQITDVVRVVGESPVLNTENAAKGSVIYNEEITGLPLQSREFFELAFLAAGVVPEPEGGQGGFASVNGARQDSMNFVLDGGNNNTLRAGDATVRPSLDSVQEFKVQTSSYSAEFGRRSTGVINVVLRSGTNRFHGSLFEFHRNSVFDARSFFDEEKPKLIRNNFGANLGGPVVRDKAFFFFNYEGWYLRQGSTRLQRTPTLAERAGDFSSLSIKLKDPVTGKNMATNVIPSSQFHPVSVKILEYYPRPNTSRGPYNYVASKTDDDDYHDYVAKFDYHFWKADNLSIRYLVNVRQQSEPFNGSDFPSFGRSGPLKFTATGVNWTHTITPRILAQVGFNFSRKSNKRYTFNHKKDYCAVLGITGCTQDPNLFGFPRVTIRGIGNIGDGTDNPLDWVENDYQVNGTTTIIKGAHNLRFGGEMVRTQFFELFPDNARGLFNFQGNWTGSPFADFLLGFLQNSNRRVQVMKNYLFSRTWAGFFQDDWKIRHNLTLNYGVRWDFFSPPTDKFGRWSNFYPEQGRVVSSGEAGFPESLVFAPKTNFAPRLGIAWRLRNRTVIRVGGGQFFGTSIQGPIKDSLGANPPFTIRENYTRQASKPLLLTWSTPFPPERLVVDGITSPSGYEIRPRAATLYQYNLTMQKEFAQNLVWEVGYVGSKGTHLGRRYNINQLYYTRQADGTVTSSRNYPAFSTIQFYAFEANSNYHALQTSLHRRGKGSDFRINYSLSKSIDDASRLNGNGDQGVAGVQNGRDRAAERGLSDFDRRHALTASGVYNIPFKRHFLIRGWQVSTLIACYSGNPISPMVSNADTANGEANRPDRIGSGKINNPTPEMWFKVSDFPPVPAGSFRFGNTGRNVVSGPNRKRWDMALVRSFLLPWGEKHRLQFRWEIYSVPNFTNFKAVDNRVDLATAGAIREAYPGREMQFALKYTF